MHGAADLGLEIGRCRRFLCPILSIYVRFLSRFPIDLGNQHLNRSPQKLIRPGIKMIDIEKTVGSFRMPSAGNQRDIASRSNSQIHQRIAPVISGNRRSKNVGINPSLTGNLADQVANCLNPSSAGA